MALFLSPALPLDKWARQDLFSGHCFGENIEMFCFFKLQFFGAYDLISPSFKWVPICGIFGYVKGANSDSHS